MFAVGRYGFEARGCGGRRFDTPMRQIGGGRAEVARAQGVGTRKIFKLMKYLRAAAFHSWLD
jgi:hypothetical protein